MRDRSVDDRLHAAVDPVFERPARVAHTHIVVTHYFGCRKSETENGVEARAELADLGRDGLTPHTEVQIPVQVEVTRVELLHQRLTGVGCREQFSEEAGQLVVVSGRD